VPVSAICQRALEQSVKRVTAIRSTVLGDLATDDPTAKLAQFTERARVAIKLGIQRAQEDGVPHVGSGHLLHGVLDEGSNLALRLLGAMGVEPEVVAAELARQPYVEGTGPANRFGGDAANVLELAVTEAISLGHNYVGCEHLLLGLIADPDGPGGLALRGLGLDLKSARAAVAAALTGYAHLRAAKPQGILTADVLAAALRPLVERIERLEAR
jgi:ATP-dependent Clp protease ATP-binding subunit ClpC